MANSIDFRADQVQTSKIIVTGSTPQKTLLIYGIDADGSPANQGNIDPTLFDTGSIGTDVFLFVSGTVGGRGGAIPNISVFGGDLHVSGNLTVDGTSPGGGGTNFFTEIAFEQIETTGSVAMTYLSSSTGGEITGSFVNGSSGLVASGLYAHAEGDSTTASGASSHAEGQATVASGQVSHAEGFASTASGQYSHAEGYATIAAGEAAHSEGYVTLASGSFSHAEGYGAEAFGTGSFAAGLYTVASGAVDGLFPTTPQAAFGKYNLRDNVESLFVVGDGLDDSNRNDVLRVNSGSVQVTGSLIASKITGSLSGTVAGNPFIVGGSGITTNYNSSGQWEITGSGGGGINPGTAGTLPKYNPAGTNLVDSQIRESANLLTLGPSNNSRLFLGWQTNNSALEWQDGAGNTPFAIYQNYSNLQTMFLGISPGLGNYSQIAFTYGGSISNHGIYFSIQSGIPQFSVVPDGIETGNINTERIIWSQSLATLRLTHRVFGTRIILNASTGDITTVGSVQITGSLISPKITGSIQYVEHTNTTPFLAAGSNITTNYNSLGQWEITGSGGGGAKSTNESLIDFFIAQNEASGYSSLAGNYSIGIRFYAATGSVSNGFRFFWSGSSPVDFEAKLWSGSVAIASSSFALTGANDYYGTWSGGPVNLSRYVNYGLTYRDTSGATYHYMNGCASLFQFLIPNSNVSPLRIGQNGVFILWTPYSYAIGDAAPNTFPTINTSTIAFIEPLISF